MQPIERDASPFLKHHLQTIIKSAPGPILDAPSGRGRNALLLQSYGATVVCVDKSSEALTDLLLASKEQQCGIVIPIRLDFDNDLWPFSEATFSAALNIHHVCTKLLANLIASIRPGGFLLVETFDNRGENYIQLPTKGELREAIPLSFEMLEYKEKSAGPKDSNKVTVRLLARRHQN